MKIFAIILCVLASDKPDEKLFKSCLNPTVQISCVESGNNATGTIIRSEKVGNKYHNVAISCNHFVSPNCSYVVLLPLYKDSVLMDVEACEARLYSSHKGYDLSVFVFTTTRKMDTAQIDLKSKLFVGCDILSFGCGLAEPPRLDRGEVTLIRMPGLFEFCTPVRISIPTVPGDSGSAVYKNYKIVGIRVCIRNYPFNNSLMACHHIAYMIPIDYLKQWSDSNSNFLRFLFDNTELPNVPFAFLWLNTSRLEGNVESLLSLKDW